VPHVYDNKLKIENIAKLDDYTNHVIDTGTRSLSEIEDIYLKVLALLILARVPKSLKMLAFT